MKNLNLNKKYTNNRIALIGHMGSGKSVIGKLMAKKLNYIHLDSDELIENYENKTIISIFETEGESKFRQLEEKIITNLNKKCLVLSLGGGSILSKKIRKVLKENFITIFLDIPLSILTYRLSKSSKRPLLINVDIEKKIKELDLNRRKYYLLADIIIKDFLTPNETLKQIFIEYNNLNEKNN